MDILADLKKSLKKISALIQEIEQEQKKIAQTQSTQPAYIDSKGEVFTASRIMGEGFKPSGKYKGYSLSSIVNSDSFGKVKK